MIYTGISTWLIFMFKGKTTAQDNKCMREYYTESQRRKTLLTDMGSRKRVSWTVDHGCCRNTGARVHLCACMLSRFSQVRLCATLRIVAWQVPPSTGILQGKNTGVGYHALLQEILPTQGSNPCYLLHHRWILYRWALGSPCTPLLPFKSEAETSQWFSNLSTHQKFLTQQSTVGPENMYF